jgi:hypothetical protein
MICTDEDYLELRPIEIQNPGVPAEARTRTMSRRRVSNYCFKRKNKFPVDSVMVMLFVRLLVMVSIL